METKMALLAAFAMTLGAAVAAQTVAEVKTATAARLEILSAPKGLELGLSGWTLFGTEVAVKCIHPEGGAQTQQPEFTQQFSTYL